MLPRRDFRTMKEPSVFLLSCLTSEETWPTWGAMFSIGFVTLNRYAPSEYQSWRYHPFCRPQKLRYLQFRLHVPFSF
jgi:hypothetical protein